MTNLSVIVIAGGKGTRMKSSIAKHLHKVGNLEIILHIIKTAENLNADEIILVCSEENVEQIKKKIGTNIKTVIQYERLGTAHATKIGYELLKKKDNNIIVMYGDIPLVKVETYKKMLEKLNEKDVVQVGTIFKTNNIQNKYGRVKIDGDNLIENIEYKDADETTRNNNLCNGASIAINGEILGNFLTRIKNNNVAKEYYLTDTINLAKEDKIFSKYILVEEDEMQGVNSRNDLALAENIFQNNKRKEFMENGVTLLSPNSVYFSYDTEIENDVIIEQNVVFLPKVKIAKNVKIHAFSYFEDCILEEGVDVGPFARIRPQTILKKSSHVGNFVEIKKSTIGEETKIGHLTYIGDTTIGDKTNIGAGTITCNYDGFEKFNTKIGNNCFVGSNTIMIAPISLENNSITGAGSVITKNVEENDIIIARAEQKVLKGKAIEYRNRRKK